MELRGVSRWVFVLGVPALVVALGGLGFVELVASGFAGEGCRFAPDDAARNAGSARDWLLAQAVASVVLLCVLSPLISLLQMAQETLRWSGPVIRAARWLAFAGFGLFALQGWHFLRYCGSGKGGTFAAAVLAGLAPLIVGCVVGFFVCVGSVYVGGLLKLSRK